MEIGIDIGGSHIGFGIVAEGKILSKKEYNFSEEEKINAKQAIREVIYKEIDEIGKNIDLNQINQIGISAPRYPGK